MENRAVGPASAGDSPDAAEQPAALHLRTAFTVPELTAGYRVFLRRYWWRYSPLYAAALVLATGAGWLAWRSGWSLLVAALLAAAASLACLRAFMLAPYFRRSLEGHPNLGQTIQWRLDPHGFSLELPDMHSAQSWASLYDVVHDEQGLLLLPQRTLFYWLPRSSFPNEAAWRQATSWSSQVRPRTNGRDDATR